METISKRYILIRGAILASVLLSLFLVFIKLIIFLHSGSLALQASLADSLLDLLAATINMFAVKIASRKADNNYQFGYHKAEAIGALIQSIFVFSVSLFIIGESIIFFFNPVDIDFSTGNLWMIVISIFLALVLVLYQRWVIAKTDSTAVKADEIHYRGDIFHYILALLVMLGVKYLHIIYLDPIGGIVISLYIGRTALKVFFEAVGVLVDVKLPKFYLNRIHDILARSKVKIGKLRTRNSSGKFYLYITVVESYDSSVLKCLKQEFFEISSREVEVFFIHEV